MALNSILFVGYPMCGEQDTLAPWEMLKSLAWVLEQQGKALDVKLGAFDAEELRVMPNMTAEGEVHMQMGGEVDIEAQLTPESRADLLYVPGGIGSGEATKDHRILDLVRAHHEEGRWLATNCSGGSILHRAGVYDKDVPVTSAATISRKLAKEGVNVRSPRKMWVCDPQRKLFTAAGGSAVHPSTIALVWHHFGQELALTLSLMWDTLGAHGDTLFELEGPDYGRYPQYEAKIQDDWEDKLLPTPA